MGDDEARELARLIAAALERVPDEEVPLQDAPFGDEHTRALLERAARGGVVEAADATAAREVLSGRPKKDAGALVEFLAGGAFSIHAG